MPLTGPDLTDFTQMPLAVVRQWRFFVCSRAGNKITELGPWAYNRKLQFRQNKPDAIQFDVRSDAPEVMVRMSDGYPILQKQLRTIKAYRREPDGLGGQHWVYRQGFIIWQTEDKADGDNVFTAVTGYSPLVMLPKMPVVDPTGTIYHMSFDGIDIGTVMVTLIDNSNTAAGL